MSHGDADGPRADPGLRVDRAAVVEDRSVERQVVCDAVTAETAVKRNGPAFHRPDADGRCGIEPRPQRGHTECIHQVPADLAVHAAGDAGEVVAETHRADRHESPLGGLADIPLGPQVSDRIRDVDEDLVRQLRVPAHRLVGADHVVEPFLHVFRLGCRAHDAHFEGPCMGRTIPPRIQHIVQIQHARIGLVVLGRVRIGDAIRRVHFLGDRPRCVRLVAVVGDERQERPQPGPLADGTLGVVGADFV
jgi:hypothetical protein